MADTTMSSYTVNLGDAGWVTLDVDVDLFTVSQEDLGFALGLVDRVREFVAAQTSGAAEDVIATPTAEPLREAGETAAPEPDDGWTRRPTQEELLDMFGPAVAVVSAEPAPAPQLVSTEVDPTPETDSHVCPDCGRGFPSRYSLSGHRKIHTAAQTFVCDDCARKFTRADNLGRHRQAAHPSTNPREPDTTSANDEAGSRAPAAPQEGDTGPVAVEAPTPVKPTPDEVTAYGLAEPTPVEPNDKVQCPDCDGKFHQRGLGIHRATIHGHNNAGEGHLPPNRPFDRSRADTERCTTCRHMAVHHDESGCIISGCECFEFAE